MFPSAALGSTVVAIVGPTATGKSDLAVRVAQELHGEILNADAFQLYRGMDIGTAKLPVADRGGIPHHLLDVLDVTDDANIAVYQKHARGVIDDVIARKRIPIVVGGSGLYVRAALDLLEIPPTDPALRERLTAEAEDLGVEVMYRRLCELDPAAAARILPGNTRRIIRALEVIELTGGVFPAQLPVPTSRLPTVQVGLRIPRPVLDERIATRTSRMWADGVVTEVRQLVEQGLHTGRTASRAVGYAQILASLAGTYDDETAQERTAQATRRLVRRQESWFKRDQRIQWVAADSCDLLDQALQISTRHSEAVAQ
ncbi:MAG: tRNA (adenosine(37)-N6)-dimethylallyltransferase MiaA [Actinomycetota bacterium]